MQSHTCTASRSLSFQYDSVLPRSMPGARPLPALISLGRYMPTNFRLVHPRTTSYWERSALIPFVTPPRLLSGLPTDPTNQHESFQRVFVLTRTLTGKLPGPQDPSHSDMIQFCLEACQEPDHSPPSSASGVTCPPSGGVTQFTEDILEPDQIVEYEDSPEAQPTPEAEPTSEAQDENSFDETQDGS
ncbi:hypothetical protein MTR_7g034645 [Medicago truncatula]|uniref:Uncharacterized protein n=1 Tax=Medicago truncatula TaxID=3880 RepID=A0A072TXS1_MEDTR|nr:hypothetical protein MTR_7g034645 [Medicago truncatula]